MIDLAIITATIARDRVADQFPAAFGRSPTASSPRRAMRRRPDDLNRRLGSRREREAATQAKPAVA